MNAPLKSEALMTPEVDYFLGNSFTVISFEEDLLKLARHILDLRAAHTAKRAISMKLCADDIKRIAGGMSNLASHLGKKTEEYVQRKPRITP